MNQTKLILRWLHGDVPSKGGVSSGTLRAEGYKLYQGGYPIALQVCPGVACREWRHPERREMSRTHRLLTRAKVGMCPPFLFELLSRAIRQADTKTSGVDLPVRLRRYFAGFNEVPITPESLLLCNRVLRDLGEEPLIPDETWSVEESLEHIRALSTLLDE